MSLSTNARRERILIISFTILTFLLTFFLFLDSANAQTDKLSEIKAVKFTDGSIVKGTVEKMTTDYITIRLPDGNVTVRKFSEVESLITKEEDVKYTKTTQIASLANRHGIGARIGYADFAGDEVYFRIFNRTVNVDVDSSYTFGVNFTYFLTEWFSIEFSIDRLNEADVELKLAGVGAAAGEYSFTSFSINPRFHIPNETLFSPYIGFGIGYYMNDFRQNASLWGSENLDIKDSFSLSVNIGTEIFLTKEKNIALNLDLKYVWTKADVDYSGPVLGTGTEELKLDSFIASLGLKYFF